MKTLADLKRELQVGRKLVLVSRFGKAVNEQREVVKTQSNGVWFGRGNDLSPSFLDYPKATLLEITDKGFKVYDRGLRDLTATERDIMAGYEKIRDINQEHIDLMTDGSTSFWQEKKYYRERNAEYLIGHTSQRGMRYDYNTCRVYDDRVKGELFLEYSFV